MSDSGDESPPPSCKKSKTPDITTAGDGIDGASLDSPIQEEFDESAKSVNDDVSTITSSFTYADDTKLVEAVVDSPSQAAAKAIVKI